MPDSRTSSGQPSALVYTWWLVAMIVAIDQHIVDAGCAHLTEGDLLWEPPMQVVGWLLCRPARLCNPAPYAAATLVIF